MQWSCLVGAMAAKIRNRLAKLKAYQASLHLGKYDHMLAHCGGGTEKVKMNFKVDQKYERILWKCNRCSNQDTEKIDVLT